MCQKGASLVFQFLSFTPEMTVLYHFAKCHQSRDAMGSLGGESYFSRNKVVIGGPHYDTMSMTSVGMRTSYKLHIENGKLML